MTVSQQLAEIPANSRVQLSIACPINHTNLAVFLTQVLGSLPTFDNGHDESGLLFVATMVVGSPTIAEALYNSLMVLVVAAEYPAKVVDVICTETKEPTPHSFASEWMEKGETKHIALTLTCDRFNLDIEQRIAFGGRL